MVTSGLNPETIDKYRQVSKWRAVGSPDLKKYNCVKKSPCSYILCLSDRDAVLLQRLVPNSSCQAGTKYPRRWSVTTHSNMRH